MRRDHCNLKSSNYYDNGIYNKLIDITFHLVRVVSSLLNPCCRGVTVLDVCLNLLNDGRDNQDVINLVYRRELECIDLHKV